MEKADYLRQLKLLIKKYHPDRCSDSRLLEEYSEITRKLNAVLERTRRSLPPEEAPPGDRLRLTQGNRKNDYAFYRLGLQFYRQIHPQRLFRRLADGRLKPRTYEEQAGILNQIYISFRISEYWFRRLVGEYPDSEWAADGRDKILFLNKMKERYRRFSLFNSEEVKSHREFMEAHGLRMI